MNSLSWLVRPLSIYFYQKTFTFYLVHNILIICSSWQHVMLIVILIYLSYQIKLITHTWGRHIYVCNTRKTCLRVIHIYLRHIGKCHYIMCNENTHTCISLCVRVYFDMCMCVCVIRNIRFACKYPLMCVCHTKKFYLYWEITSRRSLNSFIYRWCVNLYVQVACNMCMSDWLGLISSKWYSVYIEIPPSTRWI